MTYVFLSRKASGLVSPGLLHLIPLSLPLRVYLDHFLLALKHQPAPLIIREQWETPVPCGPLQPGEEEEARTWQVGEEVLRRVGCGVPGMPCFDPNKECKWSLCLWY